MKNLKNLLMYCLLFGFYNQNALATDPKIEADLRAILKKPVAKGSTDRKKALVKYFNSSLTSDQAKDVLNEILNESDFGEYFYHRLDHSTVDKTLIPLLKKIGGDISENVATNRPQKGNKPKSKKSNDKSETDLQLSLGEAVQIRELTEVDLEFSKTSINTFLINILPSFSTSIYDHISKAKIEDIKVPVDEIAQLIFTDKKIPEGYLLEERKENVFMLTVPKSRFFSGFYKLNGYVKAKLEKL